MSLPADIARCPGRVEWRKDGELRSRECDTCARRITPIVEGERIVHIGPPAQTPCPMRIREANDA